MSPSYMKEAWQKELEMIAEDGLTPDEMLVLGLEEGSDQMPFFSGCNVYPIFPGAASKWVNKKRKGEKKGQKEQTRRGGGKHSIKKNKKNNRTEQNRTERPHLLASIYWEAGCSTGLPPSV